MGSPLKIGLTGGIGSGKSEAGRVFDALGIPVFDTDQIARDLVEPGMPAWQQIIDAFGQDIQADNGVLDRQALRRRVFHDDTQRQRLEDILHPLIRDEIIRQVDRLDDEYCVIIVPLLLEKDFDSLVDRVLVIDIPESLQLERALKRDNTSETDIRQIMKSQLPRDERNRRADDLIGNEADIETLHNRLTQLHRRYLQLSGDYLPETDE